MAGRGGDRRRDGDRLAVVAGDARLVEVDGVAAVGSAALAAGTKKCKIASKTFLFTPAEPVAELHFHIDQLAAREPAGAADTAGD